jgi:hypothetical protein
MFYRQDAKTPRKPFLNQRLDFLFTFQDLSKNFISLPFAPLGVLASWRLNLILVCLFLSGCASTSNIKPTPTDENAGLLSQAASQFASLTPPKALNLRDEAQVEWHNDKSMKVTVHQLWAARVKPDHPFPTLATINQDSQILNIETLKLYQLDEKGDFTPAPIQPQIQWVVPQDNLPLSLSKITSARLPELDAGQALELKYTLETKISALLIGKDIHKDPADAKKPHPVPPEPSFAFRWNDFTPSLEKDLTLKIPGNLELLGTRLRLPDNLVVEEDKPAPNKDRTVSFTLGPQDPIPSESFQPALQDLAPLTAFTLNKTWEAAVFPYRKRVKEYYDGDPKPVEDLIGDAGSNTKEALTDRIAEVKNAIHQKVDWVDTGLPIYLNPDRLLPEVIDSAKGTSHDMAMLLMVALKSLKMSPQIYLYRQATSGELLTDLPALSQFDGILVGVPSGKDFIWIDPTESLAAPGVLPLAALDRKALGVLMPLNWKLTPAFGAKDHRRHRDIKMDFDSQGNLTCSVDVLAYGSSELALRQFFRITTDDKRRDIVYRGLLRRFPGVVLTDYRFGDYQDISKPLDVHFTFQIPNYAKFQKDGSFTFYPMEFEDVEDFFATLHNSRQTPVLVPQNFNSETEAIVSLPPGYKPGDLPKDVSYSNTVAEFSSSSKVDFGTLSYERYMGLKQRLISLGKEYQDLMNVYQTVLTQDRTPFVAVPGK